MGNGMHMKKSNIISISNAASNKIRHQYIMDGEPVCPTDTCVYFGLTMKQTPMERTYRQNQWSCKSLVRISLAISEQMCTTVEGEVVQGYCST